MKARILICLLALSVAFRADAQALPAFTGLMNKTLGQVIEKTALRRGFAANDPRMYSTYSGAATAVASVAADAAAAAATAASAPVWLSVAAGLGAAAVVGGLAYGAYKVFFDDPSSEAKFVIKRANSVVVPTLPWLPSGDYVYYQTGLTFDSSSSMANNSTKDRIPNGRLNFFGIYVYGDDPVAMMKLAVDGWIAIGDGTGARFTGCDTETSPDAAGATSIVCHAIRIGSKGNTQPESSWMASDEYFNLVPNPWKEATPYKGKIGSIVSQLSATDLAQPADASTVAALANQAWQAAASQNGYQGIPYSATDPVTTADAAAVQAANPTTWPTNADLISPVSPGAGQAVVISPVYVPVSNSTDPATPTGTQNVNVVNTPNVNVANQVKIDWGEVPNVSTPSLESTPTAQMILSPILNLMPGLRNFVVPSHSSICPQPSITIFNKNIVMDTHCSVLEEVRPTLYSVMAAVWLLLGTLVILRA